MSAAFTGGKLGDTTSTLRMHGFRRNRVAEQRTHDREKALSLDVPVVSVERGRQRSAARARIPEQLSNSACERGRVARLIESKCRRHAGGGAALPFGGAGRDRNAGQ